MRYPLRPQLPADLPIHVSEYISALESRVHDLQGLVEQMIRRSEEYSDSFAYKRMKETAAERLQEA